MKYCWSDNKETYTGEFDTIEEALEDAKDTTDMDGCWIAEIERPEYPLRIDGTRIIEEYFDRWDELHREWHENQFNESSEQIRDLEQKLEAAWKEWREANNIKTHGFNAERPKWYAFEQVKP